MPKSKGKKSSKRHKSKEQRHSGSGIPVPEDLPQVWLPVQTEEERGYFSNERKKKHVMIKEHLDRNDEDEEDLPEEQQAGILVLNADPIGWEEEEELDYTHINQGVTDTNRLPTLPIVHRPSIQGEGWEGRRGSEAPSDRGPESETHSLFNYAHSSTYIVKYIGELKSVSYDWIDEGSPHSILRVIEMGQRQGKIPWLSQEDSDRIILISKYGLKVTDIRKQRVFMRHSLHDIINVVHYTSIHSQPILAVRIHRSADLFDLFLYECKNEDQATDVCVTLGQAFDTVMNKMKMELNLRGVLQ